MTEPQHLADQFRRAFQGGAWHGPALSELLLGVDAEQAARRVEGKGHSIWEQVNHIRGWVESTHRALKGMPLPVVLDTPEDWPPMQPGNAVAWARDREQLFTTAAALAEAIERFPAERLSEIVGGRTYDYYHLLAGITQHSLYHGGQIALLKKLQ